MIDALVIGFALTLLLSMWLWVVEWWPFHGGRLFVWPFKKRSTIKWSAITLSGQPGYHNSDGSISFDLSEVTNWSPPMTVTYKERRPPLTVKIDQGWGGGYNGAFEPGPAEWSEDVTEGIYLNKNGKAHECETPDFKWERGSQLPTVWKCPCGQEWSLVAELPSEYDKERQKLSSYEGLITRSSYEERRDKLETYSKHRKKLTYADILKLGNKERTEERREFRRGWYDPLGTGPMFDYRTVSLSPEEIINDEVSFRWTKTGDKS